MQIVIAHSAASRIGSATRLEPVVSLVRPPVQEAGRLAKSPHKLCKFLCNI